MPLDSERIAEIRTLLQTRHDSLEARLGVAAKKTRGKKKTKKKTPTRRKKDPVEAAVANELAEVREAMKRLETQQERFGYCERCFMEIPWGELVANPARRYCGRCS